MTQPSSLFEAKGRPWVLRFWVFLFVLNDRSLKWSKLEMILWHFVKYELYYISGACQHSGYCCNHLELMHQGSKLTTLEAFNQLVSKKPTYSRFKPRLDSSGNLGYFSCTSLGKDNFCKDYENRPSICRQYPFSTFFQFDMIRQGCGYKVSRRPFLMLIRNERLLSFIRKVDSLNGLK